MPKLYIKTYGCQMNERDSEQVARMFVQKGYTARMRRTSSCSIPVPSGNRRNKRRWGKWGFWPSSSDTVRMWCTA